MTTAAEHEARALVTAQSLQRSPFNRWLGLRVMEHTADSIVLEVEAQEQWLSDAERGSVHGGIVAALLDTAADFALVGSLGAAVPTIDFQVNYLRPVPSGLLRVVGRLVKPGRLVATAEAEVTDPAGKVLAIGRGTYLASAAQEAS